MGDYRLTRRAAADLYNIFVYGRRQFGLVQAKAYADRLDHVFGLLADQPLMGAPLRQLAQPCVATNTVRMSWSIDQQTVSS